jgi:4'-phosphopantetheinyl transferase
MNKKDTPPYFRLPILHSHDAHFFYLEVRDFRQNWENYYELLNEEEHAKANKFHFMADKERYILARGVLRQLLSHYLQIPSSELEFFYNEYGKPYLVNTPNIHFNISHAQDIVLLAFSHLLIGVDVEYRARKLDIDSIAQRFFHINEYKVLKELSGLPKQHAFFNAWVAKEAFIKAIGKGLSYDLAKVEILLEPRQLLTIAAIHDPAENIVDWKLYPLAIEPDYAAALAVKGRLENLVVKNLFDLLE